MFWYVIMYSTVLFSVVFRKYKNISYLSFIVLFFFTICRGDKVGTDTIGAMEAIPTRASLEFSLDSANSIEILSNLVPYCICQGWMSERSVITFYACAMFLFLFLIRKKYVLNMAFLMLVFLLGSHLIYSFNIARQWVALCIIACGVPSIYDRNIKHSFVYFFYVLLATSIHASSIIFFVLYIFRWIDVKMKYLLVIIAISLVLGLSGSFTFSSILGYLTFISYADTYSENMGITTQPNFFGKLGLFLLSSIQIFALYKMGNDNKFKTLYALCIVLGLLSIGLESVVARILQGFSFMSSIFLCCYFSNYKNNFILIVFYIVLSSYLFFRSGIQDVYTFRFHDLI